MPHGPLDLFELIEKGDLKSIKLVISQYPLWIDKPDDVFGPPLCVAAKAGNLAIVQFLADEGAAINLEGGISNTNAVEHAASSGHAKVLQYLLSIGGKMETNTGQQNPLLSAIYGGHAECAKILIDHGIDFHVTYVRPGGSHFNALSHAVDYDRTEIAEYLRSKGAEEIQQPEPPEDDSLPGLSFAWFSENIGKPSNLTLRSILPTDHDIEICKIVPSKSRPFLTLFTKGLSRIPLRDPANDENIMHSEIFIQLPAQWKVDHLDNPSYFWPIEWLQLLAHNAASEKAWLGWPIAVACREEDPSPIAPNTKMDSMLLLPMHKIESDEGPDIQLYQMAPLYPEERILEKKKGAMALMEALTKCRAPLVVDVNRKSGAMAK